jgi:hypothetical protein
MNSFVEIKLNQTIKKMNWNKYIAMMVALSVFVAIISAVEVPREPRKEGETIYVLPLVEDMPAVPNPLQF